MPRAMRGASVRFSNAQKVVVCWRQMRLFATQRGRKRPGEATEGFPSGFLAQVRTLGVAA